MDLCGGDSFSISIVFRLKKSIQVTAMPNPDVPHSSRTESVDEKLTLLRRAYDAKQYELAESLADSIKDSILYDRHTAGASGEPALKVSQFIAVADLPRAWAAWADGWRFCKLVRLFETVDIQRFREPIELLVSFREQDITDPQREIRVAAVDAASGALREIPSQVWDDSRRPGERLCRLAFLADVAQHGAAAFLIFYGNPHAEQPQYTTDLTVDGSSYHLRIENEHFVIQLAEQMGQIERITSKRQHGLELYAGGKGHGEPPTIDWAHDYVEGGGWQKLRMKNWAHCRNYEVIRGPVVTHVRRWGFPQSPVHPAITPSRMHVDVSYSFWTGLPMFFKTSTMEAVKDFQIEAMRDDEWVFSGYSYDKALWIDASGKLHEGSVPPEHQNNLWGVGFANAVSKDAFIALWLDHTVTGRDQITHGGVPILHYEGHGQLWSRYPAERTALKTGTRFEQRSAYWLLEWNADAATRVERERHRWSNALELDRSPDMFVPPTNPASAGQLARPGETAATAELKPAIWDVLREVRDDQLYGVDSNIVDLGYVYDVRLRAGVAHIVVTMPHAGRPMHNFLVTQGGGRVDDGIRDRLQRMPGVESVVVTKSDNPGWTLARLNAAGRRVLGLE